MLEHQFRRWYPFPDMAERQRRGRRPVHDPRVREATAFIQALAGLRGFARALRGQTPLRANGGASLKSRQRKTRGVKGTPAPDSAQNSPPREIR